MLILLFLYVKSVTIHLKDFYSIFLYFLNKYIIAVFLKNNGVKSKNEVADISFVMSPLQK